MTKRHINQRSRAILGTRIEQFLNPIVFVLATAPHPRLRPFPQLAHKTIPNYNTYFFVRSHKANFQSETQTFLR